MDVGMIDHHISDNIHKFHTVEILTLFNHFLLQEFPWRKGLF